jgi:hypothetical protein
VKDRSLAGSGGKNCQYRVHFASFATHPVFLTRNFRRIAAGSFSQGRFMIVFAESDENIDSVRLRGSWMN